MSEVKLLKYQKMVNGELKRFIRTYLNSHISDWDKKFTEEIGSFLLNGGKRLRPILAIIIYEGTGGKDLDSFIKISLSAEILHNSTLFHDDIIDDSDIRRGRSSFHKLFEKWFSDKKIENVKKESEAMAILAGDLLNFLALQCVLDSNFPSDKKLYVVQTIRDAAEVVIRGQILDDELENITAKESDYIKLIEMKTASFFEYTTKVATALSNTKYEIASVLWKYSKYIGCAFQIQDDILGIFGKQNELGKPVTSDLAEGKKTILIIKAYEFANSEQKKILDKIIGNKNLTKTDVEAIKKLFRDLGILDYARNLANSYANKSIKLITPLKGKISDSSYEILSKLPTFIINRNY